jgi:hypothetical protein
MDLTLLRRMAGLPTQSVSSVTAANSTANEFRKLAGLSPLPIKEEPKEEMPAEEPKDEGEEEPAFPEIVTKIAAKAEGMKGDELVELIKQVYDAGVADGMKQAEESEAKED